MFGYYVGMYVFVCCVYGSSGISWVIIDDQYVKCFFGGEFFSIMCGSVGVDFGEDFFYVYVVCVECFVVQEYGWYGYDLVCFDFVLIQCVVDGDVLDVWVDDGYYVQCLDYVWVVLVCE